LPTNKKLDAREMRIKTRMMVVIGCVSLMALSVPALSRPVSQADAHKQRADLKNKNLRHAAKGHANMREELAARLVSMPISETPKRPLFGWPALVSEARRYIGTNPTDRKKLWCATFMNLVLAKVGYAGTHSDAAKSFAEYGHRVSEPEIGAIAVLSRGKTGGHVGVVSGIDKNGNPIIISGNHGHQVGEAIYPRNRVIAYVMPSDRGPGTTQFAARSEPSSAPIRSAAPERLLESPITELLAAIEAEQKRSERPSPPALQAQLAEPRRIVQQVPQQPVEPRRIVQQTPDPVPQPSQRAGANNAAIAELLGLKARAQVAQPARPAPQRERQVRLNNPSRVARGESGLAGAFSFR
jgi:uncharacterized protein (TIGR02594 family)